MMSLILVWSGSEVTVCACIDDDERLIKPAFLTRESRRIKLNEMSKNVIF